MKIAKQAVSLSLSALLCSTILSCATAGGDGDWLGKGKELLGESGSKALTTGDISAGLREALKVGTERVVGQLGQADGFAGDSAIRIPLPEKMQEAKKWLDKAGMGSGLADLELQLNRAAEAATPKARQLFINAISEMSIEDAKQIYRGPDNAATEYFKEKMTAPLQTEMRPIVSESLAEVGAVKTYDKIMGKYESLPFAPDIKGNLTDYAVEKGMDGIFYYLAKEEAEIRANPAARTTELLKKVFGSKQ